MNLFPLYAFAFGSFIIYITLTSVIRTFVLPRAITDRLTTAIFQMVRYIFDIPLRFAQSYERKDRILALYAPVALLTLPPVWLTFITIGFTFLYRATGITNWEEAFIISGSSILTLGFAKGTTLFHHLLSFFSATLGLVIVALIIAYLPTMYAAFARREVAVNQLSVRADSPPSPVELLLRYHRLNYLDNKLGEFWEKWETWFVELEESHTSLSALVFFRSPLPDHSWANAAGVVLDAAALRLALLELPHDIKDELLPSGQAIPGDPRAAITIRAGFLALQRIADYFSIEYNPSPSYPDDQITIERVQFDMAVDIFRSQGLPLKKDFEQAWLDFAGWRVNYDSVLTALKEITLAPDAPWIAAHRYKFEKSLDNSKIEGS